MRYLLYLFCVFAVLQTTGQEALHDLSFNPSLREGYQAKRLETAERSELIAPFFYTIEPLDLPFVDDFSTDRIKRYNARKTDPNVTPTVRYAYSVNGLNPDTLSARFDTTYRYIKNGSEVDTVNNEALTVVTFNEDFKPVDTNIVWTNIELRIDVTTGNITADTLPAQFQFKNFSDTLYVVAPDNSLWVTHADEPGRGAPFVNNTFPINPPTQGVATFDGTDAAGFPYDISSSTSQGSADTLESVPLNIDSTMNNVYLSFFYQAGGLGNTPEGEDSLVVEFFNVRDSLWTHAWSVPGTDSNEVFEGQVFLPINGRRFKQKGFKFRFRNYASLSGSFDHWHIDYVKVDENRDTLDTVIADVSILENIPSWLEPYSAVPYSHYVVSQASFDRSNFPLVLQNLGEDRFVQYRCYALDLNGDSIYLFKDQENNVPSGQFDLTVPLPPSPVFPDLGQEYVEFDLGCYLSITGGNDIRMNDTMRTKQTFFDYYAYDDGTAEKAYSLTGAGAQLAYQFVSPVSDTLLAINFNFPQLLFDQNDLLPIQLMVLNKDFLPVYESEFTYIPRYTGDNNFFRMELEDGVPVNGIFYVGFRQIERSKIYIGFDVNTDHSERIFYNTNGSWIQTSFTGSLMIRPDFGTEDLLNTVEEQALETEFSVYPNPTSDFLQIKLPEGHQLASVTLFNIHGQLILNQTVNGSGKLDLRAMANGQYILHVSPAEHSTNWTEKITIQH